MRSTLSVTKLKNLEAEHRKGETNQKIKSKTVQG